MESLRLTCKRQNDDLVYEIGKLEKENQKLKKKLGINDDDGVIDVDDDSESDEEEP
jgi:cell shape-determining protein MreC